MIGIIGDSEKRFQIVLVRSKFEEDLERLKRIVIPLEINITSLSDICVRSQRSTISQRNRSTGCAEIRVIYFNDQPY